MTYSGRGPDATQPAAGGVAWAMLAILVGLCMLSFLDRQIVALLVEPIRADLGISDFEISLLQGAAFGLFYAVSGVPLGWMVDRFERRRVIWSGVTIWSLATVASGLSRSFGALFGARLGVGAAEAALSPAAYSMISDMFPRRQLAFVLSIYSAGATIGSAAAFLLGSLLITWLSTKSIVLPGYGLLATWQATFVVLGIPGVLLAWLIFAVPEPARRHTLTKGASDWPEFYAFLKTRRPLFSLHFPACGLISMIGYGHFAWLPTYLTRHFHLDIATVGLILGPMIAICGIGGGVTSGWIVDRMYARGIQDAHMLFWVWASLAIAVFASIAFSADSLWLFLIFCGLVQMLLPFSGVAAAAVQIATPARFRGRASSLFILVFNILGLGLGASVVAFYTDFVFQDDAKVGLSIAATTVTLAPIAALMFWFSRKPMRAALEQVTD